MEKAKKEIYKEEFIQYLCVWIFFGVAILLVFWLYNPSFYIACDYSSEFCSAINNVIKTLSLSYIAGFIFFLLSVFIPNANKKYEDEYQIAFYLDKLKKDYLNIINFSENSDNFQKPSFEEFCNSLFVEDVSDYCKDLSISNKNGECDINVHFKPGILLQLELNVNDVREDLNLLHMLSPKLPYPIIQVLSKIKSSRLISEIGYRRGFSDKYTDEDQRIRLILFKMMMQNYRIIEIELMDVVNNNNKNFPNFKKHGEYKSCKC